MSATCAALRADPSPVQLFSHHDRVCDNCLSTTVSSMGDQGGAPPIPQPVGLFSHTGGQSTEIFYTSIAFPIFALPIVGLRLYTSKVLLRRWHNDDTLTIIAAVFALLQSICVCIQARLGAGDHITTMTPDGITLLLASGKWAGVPLYNITTLFVKASVLAFYLRFLVETSFQVFTYIVIFFVVSYSIVNTAATLAFNCTNDLPDVCGTMIRIYIACGALNVLTDVIILLLPFWILRPMKVPFHRKIGIALVLMGGGFVVAVSIIRLVATVRIDSDPDVTYGWGTSVMWCLIESWSGLICASLPCLKAFFSRYLSHLPIWRLLGTQSRLMANRTLALITFRRFDDESPLRVNRQASTSPTEETALPSIVEPQKQRPSKTDWLADTEYRSRGGSTSTWEPPRTVSQSRREGH